MTKHKTLLSKLIPSKAVLLIPLLPEATQLCEAIKRSAQFLVLVS
jgi:hypothetical protein